MDGWIDESMRTKTVASDYSFVGCSASFKPTGAFRAQLCSVQCRYPRGRRRGGEAAAARTKGKKTLVFSLFFSAARASDFAKH
jgi:hypothetical protein